MLAQERHNQILSLLDERGSVRTIDMAREFQVTDETIRRDLQILEKTHQLIRVHGGASSPTARPRLKSFTERRTTNVEKKRAIAQAALEWIQPGETIVFDSSTTVFELVLSLPNIPLRVVTNAHAVIHQLIESPEIEIVATGGQYHPKTQTFNSPTPLPHLKRLNIQKAFVSCIGLDFKRGASEGFETQAIFKESLLQLCEEVVLLVDSTKLNKRSEYFFASLDNINHVITDSGVTQDQIVAIEAAGCKVTIANPQSVIIP